MARDKREKRDLHALDADGMVLCNPRDREAAHRAEVEGIATADRTAVTCSMCVSLLYRGAQAASRLTTAAGDPPGERPGAMRRMDE